MRDWLRAAAAGAKIEWRILAAAPYTTALIAVQSVTFLVLVSLFGLTGARAPTAVVDLDHSAMSAQFIQHLRTARDSFDVRLMSAAQAQAELHSGHLVDIITIPRDFSETIDAGGTVGLGLVIDNVDVDLTDDVERALPSAISAFARDRGLSGIRVIPAERDLVDHETGYVSYLVVSALALEALVLAGILGAMSVTRDIERGTLTQWRLAPPGRTAMVAGKVVATSSVGLIGVLVAVGVVVLGYGVRPVHPAQLVGALMLCCVIFACVGLCVGMLVRKTLPVAALLFGLAMPLYLDSGALEPERYDGNVIWTIAHISPVYSAVGLLEDAAHGLQVTPESLGVNALVLCAWAAVAAVLAVWLVGRRAGA